MPWEGFVLRWGEGDGGIGKMAMISRFSHVASSSIFFWRCFVSLVNFSYWSKFHANIITVLELWQFLFIRDRPEIWKLEIPPSEFCPISEDWSELGIPNLARMFLECCKMSGLQLLLLTFYFYRGVKLLPPPSRLGLINYILIYMTRGYDTNGNKKRTGNKNSNFLEDNFPRSQFSLGDFSWAH